MKTKPVTYLLLYFIKYIDKDNVVKTLKIVKQ